MSRRDRFSAPERRYDYPNPGPLFGEPEVKGRQLPHNRGEDREGLSPWGRLCDGGAIGKKSVLIYNANNSAKQNAGVSMLQVEGDDMDAQQLILTLAPPTIVPIELAVIAGTNLQNVTGEQNNFQVDDRTFPGTAGPTVWPPLLAEIEWGVGGTSVKATVDYVNGMTVNLVASWVRVTARIASSEESDVVGTSAAYVLAAFVGPGITKPGIARRTIYTNQISDGVESDVFPVPRFASRATVIACDPASPPAVNVATLRFWQSADGVAGGNNVGNFLITGNTPGPFDVPNAAQYFSVINGTGVADLTFAVLFELAI